MEEFARGEAADAALVAAAQNVEHYEIASYGSMCAWADHLGLQQVAVLLRSTLEEEQAADAKLTELAEQELSQQTEVGGNGHHLSGKSPSSPATNSQARISPR
jgi:ferritin-like metal-binding protein YciE